MRRVLGGDDGKMLLLAPSAEDWIESEHPARLIREFVEAMNLKGLGLDTLDRTQGGVASDRRWSVRGLEQAGAQWAMLAITWNLRVIYRRWRDGRDPGREGPHGQPSGGLAGPSWLVRTLRPGFGTTFYCRSAA